MERYMLRTKIVCTIGPASRDPATLAALIRAGMDVARLNMSHGDLDFHRENIRRIRQLSEELHKPVAIMADLQGPKLRMGSMPAEGVPLRVGDALILTTEHIIGGPGRVPVQYERLPESVKAGDRILIDDGLLELHVTAVEGCEIHTRVVTEGTLTSNKGLNLPHASFAIPAITEKDREDLRFVLGVQVDAVALSFVRSAAEVLELKDEIRDISILGRSTPVIAKIEKPEAVESIDAIIAAADGAMVARGDLGIEMSTEAVPMVQKMIIAKCNQAGKPVITATQMLDSMIRNPRPTRAEASDVANAILDGSDAIMLSGETAAGKYPVLAVETMVRIACETELARAAWPTRGTQGEPKRGFSFSDAVAHATVGTASDLNAKAIVVPTVTGQTARTMASYRPGCAIVAATPSPITQRQLMFVWGVYPVLGRRSDNTDQVLSDAVEAAQRHGYVSEGDVVVITGGSAGSGASTTNLMKVHLIERVLARGDGLGDRRVSGRVRWLKGPLDPSLRIDSDEIVVAPSTDHTFVRPLRRAAGLVTADKGEDSHSYLLALELGIPAVVGAREGIDALSDGIQVVLDAKRGVVYERPEALVHVEE
jgi:pyruvate kinase